MLKQGNIDKIWQIVATVTGDKETERVVVSPLFYWSGDGEEIRAMSHTQTIEEECL